MRGRTRLACGVDTTWRLLARPVVRRTFSAALLLSLPVAASAQGPALNEWCPVMTEEKADPEITTSYAGKTVAFCCDQCLAKFRLNPNKYLPRLPQFAAESGSIAGGAPRSDHHEPAPESHGSPNPDGHAHGTPPKPTEADSHGHQHAPVESEDDRRIPWFGRLHPVLVHFPLAGLPVALLGWLAGVATKSKAFAKADVPALIVATLASVAAVITGNIAHDSMRFSASMHEIVERHQFVSTSVMVLSLCLLALRVWRWNTLSGTWSRVYGGGLLLASGLLGLTGYLGGSLVFGPDHLQW